MDEVFTRARRVLRPALPCALAAVSLALAATLLVRRARGAIWRD